MIAAFEINHWMKRKKRDKVGFSALKIDMSKAYDRVEWDYIRDIVQKMRFDNKWIN